MKKPQVKKPPAKKPRARSKRQRGQPAFVPKPGQRKDVMLYKAAGLSEPAIAAALGISQNTLRKYFEAELGIARGVQRAKNLKRLEKAAEAGSVTAQKALHSIFDQGEKSDLANEDFGAEQPKTPEEIAAEKVRNRPTKKDQVHADALNAGVGSEWAEDLPPPPSLRN